MVWTRRNGDSSVILHHDSSHIESEPRTFAINSTAIEASRGDARQLCDRAVYLGSLHNPFTRGLWSVVSLQCSKNPISAQIAERNRPFVAAYLRDVSFYMVSRAHWKGNYRFNIR